MIDRHHMSEIGFSDWSIVQTVLVWVVNDQGFLLQNLLTCYFTNLHRLSKSKVIFNLLNLADLWGLRNGDID